MADIEAEVTEEERSVMRECVREAFWYRSLPAAAITGEDPHQSFTDESFGRETDRKQLENEKFSNFWFRLNLN